MMEINWTDEERFEAMKDMTPEESLAYAKSFYVRITEDPEILSTRPLGFMERLKANIDLIEQSIAAAKMAARNAEFLTQTANIKASESDRLADEMLKDFDPKNFH